MGAHDLVWILGATVILGLLIIIVSIWLASQLPDVDQPEPEDPESPGNIFTCEEGDCKFDLLTGVKTCPTSDEEIEFDPTKEGCTPPEYCVYSQWTNALQPDGSTDGYGRCQPGDQCACLRAPICGPTYSSTWTIEDGRYTPVDPWNSVSMRTRISGQPLPVPSGQFCHLPGEEVFNIDQIRCTGSTVADLSACDLKYRNSVLEICPGGRLAVYSESFVPETPLESTTVVCAQASPTLSACPGLLSMNPSTGSVQCGGG